MQRKQQVTPRALGKWGSVGIAIVIGITAYGASKSQSAPLQTTTSPTAANLTATTITTLAWFQQHRDDFFKLDGDATTASRAMILDFALPSPASDACAVLKTDVEKFRIDLPVPDPAVSAALSASLDQLQDGVTNCRTAISQIGSAPPVDSAGQTATAIYDFEAGPKKIRQALLNPGVPITVS